jgi:hypothetical protein
MGLTTIQKAIICDYESNQMENKMKRIMLITVLFIMLAMLYAQSDSGAGSTLSRNSYKPMVVVNNMSTSDVSLKIGDDNEDVYYIYDLANGEVSELTPVNYTGTYTVYYMFPEDDDWVEWKAGDTEDPFTVTLINGNILSLLVKPDDGLQTLTLDFTASTLGKVMFFNLTGEEVPVMEVGKEFGDRNIVYCDNMSEYSASNFGDVPAGNYCMFWQTIEQKDTDKFWYFPDSDMNYKLKEFADNNWYQMMVHKVDGKYFCTYNNITPSKPMLRTQ